MNRPLSITSIFCGIPSGVGVWKTNAPFPIWLWLYGHEWAKWQLEKARVGSEALDNGFRSCADAARLEAAAEEAQKALKNWN